MLRPIRFGMLPVAVCLACSPAASPNKPSGHAMPAQSKQVPTRSCREAATLLDEVDRRLHPGGEGQPPEFARICAATKARAVAELCPALRDRASALARIAEERERAQLPTVLLSEDRRWLAAANANSEHGRLWALEPAGPRLVFRGAIEGTWQMGPDARLYGLESKGSRGLFVFDSPTNRVRRFEDVSAMAIDKKWILLLGKCTLRRLDHATLQVTATTSLVTPSESKPLRVLAGGRSALVGTRLVSFEKQAVLREEVRLVAASRDEHRIVSCGGERQQLEVIDSATGATLAQWSTKGTAICTYSRPTMAPDGAHVFGVDSITDRKGIASRMAVIVYDVSTKKTRRFLDRTRGFGTALGAATRVQTGPDTRLCIQYGSKHWEHNECPWVIQPSATILIRPQRTVPMRPRGVTGKELRRATSEAGSRVAILSFTDRSKNPEELRGEALRLAIVNPHKKALVKTIPVLPGPFTADGRMTEPADRTALKPTIQFLGDSRLTVSIHGMFTKNGVGDHAMVVDVGAGTVRRVEQERLPIPLGGRWALVGPRLVDLSTGREYSLHPTAEAWDKAVSLTGPCTTWNEP